MNPARLKVDSFGRPLCRCGCGEPVGKGRRTFAGHQCVHEWRLRTDPGYLRDQTFLRDHGVCRKCGLDTERARKSIRGATTPEQRKEALKFRALGFPPGNRTWWNADHIVEVVRGGGECGLDNIQTLCLVCHKLKTRELAAERAAERAIERHGPMLRNLP